MIFILHKKEWEENEDGEREGKCKRRKEEDEEEEEEEKQEK